MLPMLPAALLAALLAVPAGAQEAPERGEPGPEAAPPPATARGAAGASGAGSQAPDAAPDAGSAPTPAGPVKNGFDLAGSQVPADKIIEGGPGRDEIRSVDAPAFVEPAEATWVAPDTPVLGVEIDGVARAYPVHLLEFHQIVNDEIDGVPVAVTFDPLTGVPRVYERRVGDRTLTFGVSGLIHNASFLMFDRETESLWLHFTGRALDGPLAGRDLKQIRVRQEPFGRWLERAPETVVLVRPEPRKIDYRYSPFSTYWVKDAIPFPVEAKDTRFHAKELVVGVVVDGKPRAYLGSILTAAGGEAVDRVGGHEIRIRYTSELGTFEWEVPEEMAVTEAFWFAWKAFHPDTTVWQPPTQAGGFARPRAATRPVPPGN